MEPTAYDLCVELYGTCSCADKGRSPCATMASMVDEGLSAQDERDRMEDERDGAALDDF